MPRPARVGDSVKLRGIDWAASEHTLLFVLRKDCSYCTSSRGFYKRALEVVKHQPTVRTVAALPHEPSMAREYLTRMGLDFDIIVQVDFENLGIMITPSLFLVDRRGVIEQRWLGQLKFDKEAEVLSAIGHGQQ
jgi:peroxiredoxin